MVIKEITVTSLFADPDYPKLEQAYFDEGHNNHISLTNRGVNRDYYIKSEAMGFARCLGCFDEDKIVGFAVLFCIPSPHYAGSCLGTCESIFIHPDYRKGYNGVKLLKRVRSLAKELGCSCVLISSPAGSRLETLLSHVAKPVNSIFSMRA